MLNPFELAVLYNPKVSLPANPLHVESLLRVVDGERHAIADLLELRAQKEAPNAAEALRFMAQAIRENRKLPEHMLGSITEGN